MSSDGRGDEVLWARGLIASVDCGRENRQAQTWALLPNRADREVAGKESKVNRLRKGM